MPNAQSPRPAVQRRRPHPDRPDTDADLDRLAALPEGAARARLQERVIRAWLPMAMRLAHRYRERGEDLEDLEQVASLGLTKAVQRFDPARGNVFETYAVPVITGELKKHFRDHAWDLHVPRRVQELRNRVRKAIRELEADPAGGPPTPARIAAHLDIPEADVRAGLEAMDSFRSLSLDAAAEGDGGERRPLADTLSETEEGYDLIVLREAVGPALRRLPERERHILYLRYYREMAQSSIALELGVSQMHISRILRSTYARVRRDAGIPDPDRTPRRKPRRRPKPESAGAVAAAESGRAALSAETGRDAVPEAVEGGRADRPGQARATRTAHPHSGGPRPVAGRGAGSGGGPLPVRDAAGAARSRHGAASPPPRGRAEARSAAPARTPRGPAVNPARAGRRRTQRHAPGRPTARGERST